MAFDLQQLRQVIALAEHGSFVRAAAALHISQPALSRSIQNLERDFGADLFHRSASGAIPTERGSLFIEGARDLLRMSADLDRDARADRSLSSGRLALGGGPYPTESFLLRATSQFLARYPQVSIILHAQDYEALLARLRSRELDFFVAETSTFQREADLEIEPLTQGHGLHFIARAGHPLTQRVDLTDGEVLSYPLVVPSRMPPRVLKPLLAAQRGGRDGTVPPPPLPAVRVSSVGQVIRMLQASDAVSASILSCIESELERRELVLLASPHWLLLEYGIVRLKNRPRGQHAMEFEELIRKAQAEAVEHEARLLSRYQRRKSRARR
jgi:DNA-binding transcriptional LysR family regulator